MSKSMGVLSSLNGMLPDERPVRSLQVVESSAKCPAGYTIVNRTYDEDADAGLLKPTGLFGKKPSHYICLSKSEGLPGYVMDGVAVVGEREAPPAGFGVAARVGKRRLCTRVSRAAPALAATQRAPVPPVTDVIVCSRMRAAPQGFLLAGEINGKMVCYKVGGRTDESATTPSYENVVNHTPDAARRLRSAPERPPKLSPLAHELDHLNLKRDEFETSHDYEALSTSYNVANAKPTRPAPPAPHYHRHSVSSPPHSDINSPMISPAPPPGRHKKGPAPLPRANPYNTLGTYNALDGVPFQLNPKLQGTSAGLFGQIPIVKRRTRAELDKEFSYNFSIERQTT